MERDREIIKSKGLVVVTVDEEFIDNLQHN
jgi:hypothetical protein